MPVGTKSQAHCQCDPSCKNPPLENSPFCAAHIKFCPRQAPLSGYEPSFDPDKYNKKKGIKEAQNCFAYAFDHTHLPKRSDCTTDSCPIPFPQPGRASGYPKWSKIQGKRCPDLNARVMGDVPGSRMSAFNEKCPKGMTKIAAVTDEDEDYHFYRQDSNGYWSHKPGATDVTHLDATKRPIYDPSLAKRAYEDSGLDYDNFCGYMCIPVKKHKLKRGGHFLKKSAQKTKRSLKKSARKTKRSLKKSAQKTKCTKRKARHTLRK
jgi:hypothetical protein